MIITNYFDSTLILTSIKFRFVIQAEVKVTNKEDMEDLLNSETRILLLYSTKVLQGYLPVVYFNSVLIG